MVALYYEYIGNTMNFEVIFMFVILLHNAVDNIQSLLLCHHLLSPYSVKMVMWSEFEHRKIDDNKVVANFRSHMLVQELHNSI